MGIFSNLFGKKNIQAQKADWPGIVNEISNGLESVRNMWFDQCKDNLMRNGCIIKNDVLQDTGLTYAKTFQLFNSFIFIGGNEYVSQSEGKDFADTLFKKVCPNDVLQVVEYQGKIRENYSNINSSPINVFTMNIANYITGNKDLIFEPTAIGLTLPGFVGATQMVIASSFGDYKKVRQLESRMK